MKVTVPVTLMNLDRGSAVLASLDVEAYPTPQTTSAGLLPGKHYVSMTVEVAIRGYGVDEKVHIIVPVHELNIALLQALIDTKNG